MSTIVWVLTIAVNVSWRYAPATVTATFESEAQCEQVLKTVRVTSLGNDLLSVTCEPRKKG